MTVTIPHKFKDGVGETASGVQVDDNFDAVKVAIDAIETRETAYPGGSSFLAANTGRGLSTYYTPSSTQGAMVYLIVGAAPSDAVCQIIVDGVNLWGGIYLSLNKSVALTFFVKANGKWRCDALAGPMNLLTSTYQLLPNP